MIITGGCNANHNDNDRAIIIEKAAKDVGKGVEQVRKDKAIRTTVNGAVRRVCNNLKAMASLPVDKTDSIVFSERLTCDQSLRSC